MALICRSKIVRNFVQIPFSLEEIIIIFYSLKSMFLLVEGEKFLYYMNIRHEFGAS